MPARAAARVLDAFLDYNGRYSDITRRARRHFERRDWRAAQADATARIDLYDACIAETLTRLELLLDDRVRSRSLWAAMRDAYARLVEPHADRELFRTFFNTLSRRFFRTRGVDEAIEFVDLHAVAAVDDASAVVECHNLRDPVDACRRLLEAQPFAIGYQDPAHSAALIARELAERALEEGAAWQSMQVLRTVFYREQRAYLVGRLVGVDACTPLVVAFVSTPAGVRADAVLTNLHQVSQLFGYARSAFQADLAVVSAAVAFLHALLPHRPRGELYTVLGRIKQGKTERCRELFAHLARAPDDRVMRAEGARGMVMLVVTPRSHAVVIKLIRDRFAWPKEGGRAEVERRYRLVARHDRVGRLIDAQEFRYLRLPRAAFEPEVLAEIESECASSIEADAHGLVFRHCYVERRLRPLDLYLREVDAAAGLRAVLDYAQAIEDLARVNIFPGDLLLKNFGVSRIGRVVFYDYDELCLVEECRFRHLPDAPEGEESRPVEDWLSVRPNDVFPAQFPQFLGLAPNLREALVQRYAHLFDPDWWNGLRERFLAGETLDVPPYPAAARLPE
ncbi:MAG: bifunctional isocitrate dehydrogenase kinase/phosphatase [Lysobacteraceae bacterium]|nr:MAG: bifunctional isocitrate dehydrogenase kinase/phosphatase [Xanthomonadaceae bacterium]